MYPTSATVMTYTAKFTGAWDMKMWKSDSFGNWDMAFGSAKDGDGAESGTLVNTGAGAIQTPEAGYYTITADFQKMTYSWTKLDNQTPTEYNSIAAIGTFSGWSDVEMTKANDHNWYLLGLKIEGDQKMKFRANNAWDVNWGGDIDLTKTYFGTGVANGGDMPIAEGTYNVYFNDITGQFVLEAQE